MVNRFTVSVLALAALALALCVSAAKSPAPREMADDPEVVATAEAAMLRGDYAEAIRIFDKLHSIPGSSSAAAHAGLLRALLEVGQYSRVEELAKSCEHTAAANCFVLRGQAEVSQGKYREAQISFERGMETESARAEAEMQLALLLELTGRSRESRDHFASVYNQTLGSNRQMGLAALALQHLQRFKEANTLFKRATQLNPTDFDTWIEWGHLFLQKYNPAEAASVFEDVLKTNANHPRALLGLALCRNEGSDDAEKIISRVLALNPNLEAAHAAKAQIALQGEVFEEAKLETEVCLKINPNSLQAQALNAVLHYAQGRESLMQSSIDAALKLNPKYGEVYESLGHFCVTQRLYRESVDFFRKAIEVNSSLWSAHAALGVNLLRIGQEKAAKAALDLAFENDPYNVWTFNTLKLIDSYDHFEQLERDGFHLRLHQKESKLLAHYVPNLLEESYRALSSKYDFSPEKPIYFEMFPDHEDFAVRTLGVPGLGALGVCFGKGIVMDSPSARPKGSFNWGSTLWHEFAHVVTVQATNHRVPRWFTEGLSVMEEHHARPGWGNDLNLDAVKAIQEKKLLPISSLNRGFLRPQFPGQVQLSYFQAGEICDFIVREYGFKSILKMLQLFKSRLPLADVLLQALGVSPEAFDDLFMKDLTRRYAQPLKSVDFGTLQNKKLLKDKSELAAFTAEHPDNFFANLKLARYYRDEGDDLKAVELLKKAKSLFPGYVEADSPYKELSIIYKRQGKMNEAIEELQALSKLHDSDFDSLKQLAFWLEEMHRTQEACNVLEQAMFVYPFDLEAHQTLASLSQQLKNYPAALREYRALLALDPPDKASVHFGLAKALIETGQTAEAKKEALAALEIAPGYEPAQELLLKTLN